jgi:hypothetical protein
MSENKVPIKTWVLEACLWSYVEENAETYTISSKVHSLPKTLHGDYIDYEIIWTYDTNRGHIKKRYKTSWSSG